MGCLLLQKDKVLVSGCWKARRGDASTEVREGCNGFYATRSSKFPCLISSNPHESMDILTLSRFSVRTQSITKGTSQNPAQWEHLPSPCFSGPSWMGLLGAASLAITNKLSKRMSEPSQHLPPLSDGCKEPQFPQEVRGEGWQMGW